MALNMVSGFMVTRSRRTFPVLGVFVSLALLSFSCERVPLLAPTGSTITLSTATSALGFNGTADIVAQVLEAAGTPPHSGTHIIFSTNLGRVDPAEVQTDVNGRATTRFFAGNSSGIATITASSGGAVVPAANAVRIAVGSAAVSSIVLAASPAVLSSNGGSSTITAKVAEPGGASLAGIPVTFTTTAGALSASVANTDANGIATTTLTTNRTAVVTGTAGLSTSSTGTGGTTTTPAPKSEVTVAVNVTSTIAIGAPVPATPAVNQTVSFPLTYTTATGASPIVRLAVDWGDGRTSNFSGAPSSIAHAYSAPGSYLVQVTGFDALGDSATASSSVNVTGRAQPTVAITFTPAAPAPGERVTFTITATPTANNTITSIFIDFGDGNTRSLPASSGTTTVQHTYANANTYQVTATATDTSGASGSGSTVVVVK